MTEATTGERKPILSLSGRIDHEKAQIPCQSNISELGNRRAERLRF